MLKKFENKFWRIQPFHQTEREIDQSKEMDSVIGNWRAKMPESSSQTDNSQFFEL